MATVGYASALGSIAKDAISGAGKGFIGGLKGAMMTEAPGITGAYAFGKELRNRANAPRVVAGRTSSSSPSSSSAMGGFGASVAMVASQSQGNVINLEQVRQLKRLNTNVVNQSKLLLAQINDTKRKDLFAEETANEQALRDEKLLNAIERLGGGRGGRGGAGGGGDGGDDGSLLGGIAAGFVLRKLITGIVRTLAMTPQGRIATGLGLGALAVGNAMANTKQPSTPAQAKNEYDDLVKRQAALDAASKKEYKQSATGAGQSAKYQQIMAEKRKVDEQLKTMRPSVANKDGTAKVVTESNYLDNLARAESSNDPNARNPLPGQTASGLYQFTKGTWSGTVEKMAARGIISRADYADEKNRFDPAKAKKVAEFFTEQNALGLRKSLGRDPTQADLYMAHFLGLGATDSGAIRFLQAYQQNPDALAISFVGADQAKANQAIFYTNDVPPRPRTLAEVYGIMSKKIGGAGAPATGNKNTVPSTGNTPVVPNATVGGFKKEFKVQNYRAGNQLDKNGVSPVEDYYKSLPLIPEGMPTPELKSKTGSGDKTSSAAYSQILAAFSTPFDKNKFGRGIQLAAGSGFNLGGGGTEIKDDKPVSVHDKKAFEQNAKIAKGQGINATNGTILNSSASSYGKSLNTQAFKPLFRSNSDIISQVNKTFLQQFRSTATAAFTQAITKGLFPKGFGVSFSQASQDDMYRGQQLQKIFGTSNIISSATTKLLGKQYGPMFAPLFDNLAQGYLEVGSRMAGKAIFQGIGGLDARESQGIMGQVLGNYAAGNKKLAFEQLLFGASGGAKSGIALGAETLFAKYGFANPAEGISYFASALGERATQPFAKLMGADDRSKSVIFDPRSKQYVYADSGAPASQADVNAAGAGYGDRISQTPLFGPSMNNYGMPGAPYQTTAGVGGTYQINNSGAYKQILNARPGQEISRAQAFGLTDQQQAAGGAKLIAEQNTMLRAQGEVQNKQLEQQAKLAEEAAKREFDIASKKASSDAEQAQAQAAYDKALNEAKTSTDRVDTDRVIAKLDQVGGKASGGGTQILDKDGNPVTRRSGQLFGQSYDKNTGQAINDPMKDIGNFAFDMGKNMLGQQLTKDIKNPYAQMVANFAIQKGLNYGVDLLFGKGDATGVLSPIIDQAGSWIMDTALPGITSFFGFADGGVVTKATPGVFGEAGAEAIIPLANPNATKALSAAMGTDKTLSELGDQTGLLTSIDGSLRAISGRGTSSGTGLSFDSGLGGVYSSGLGGGSISSGSAVVVNGVARSRATQQKPSTMDYVSAIGGSMLKSFAINQAIGAVSTAAFGATPMALLGNAYSGLQLGMAGFTPATFVGPLAPGALTGMELGASFAGGSSAAAGTAVAAEGATAAAVAEGGLAASGGLSAGLATAMPYIAAALVVFAIFDSYGGGGSSPPPKEPKFHAAIYITGNNNVNAIQPMYETFDYHAVPDVYKTIAYGLLRVAFNATKSSEQVTKISAPYDFIYMKVQFDRISMLVGKGAPSLASLQADTATEVLSWPAPAEGTNLNTHARDIIHWVRDEFKKVAKDENLDKLDKAASALGSYTLDEISRGLIPDLQKGKYALDKNVEKGIYANNVAESNRIAQLIQTAESKKAYTTEATADTYEFDPNDTDYRNGADRNLVKGDPGGIPMVYSLKDGAYVENKFPGAILIDTAGRPVYDIEGTSAGLTVDDFVSASIAGTNRPANILPDTPAGGAGGGGSTTVATVTGPTVDNSAVTNYYQNLSSVVDPYRGATPQVG